LKLQIYRRWEKAGRDPEWCRRKGLQARSLKFAADVRRQLAAAVSKEADVRRQLAAAVSKEADVRNGSQDLRNEPQDLRNGSQDVRNGSQDVRNRSQDGSRKKDESTEQRTVPLRKALCIGFANKLARRMTKHNGYRTMGEKSQLVQVGEFQGSIFKVLGELTLRGFHGFWVSQRFRFVIFGARTRSVLDVLVPMGSFTRVFWHILRFINFLKP
jgi:hypothetical protein